MEETLKPPVPGPGGVEAWDAGLQPLLALTRGGRTEAVYRGVWVEVDAQGRVLSGAGDPSTLVHLRSAAKPFQALALVESGAAEVLCFSDRELALACASHAGSAPQVAVVEGLLARLGFAVGDLECGTSPPQDAEEARRLERAGSAFGPQHHMCSGKHAAMLALARHLDVDPAGYSLPSHPVQQMIFSTISRETGLSVESLYGGIDGCGVPVVSLPARVGALLFARLAAGSTPAFSVLRRAMLAYPELVAGEGRLDTRVMRAGSGAVLSKSGAGGVLGLGRVSAGSPPTGARGCLVKMAVDPGRHMAAVAAGVVSDWGLTEASSTVWPDEEQRLLNGLGAEVGRVERLDMSARSPGSGPSAADGGSV